jgi:hypothetical protein
VWSCICSNAPSVSGTVQSSAFSSAAMLLTARVDVSSDAGGSRGFPSAHDRHSLPVNRFPIQPI